ncbi:protein of unknown function [Magnetospirillum sp. XM-1]|uniref:hypothetical protein n=1 Tax=Magnetospirillum sp. XM-1 TaxID=1663591 RepID=UPI00073DF527|nr:hypothetical protein [Magnetospirillum sp. XM-1]CUW38812.1 protein of unknown function [Magnetospirillum sp. XM-1]
MKPDFEKMAGELDVPYSNSESIADALRAAYAAGLERAAEIACGGNLNSETYPRHVVEVSVWIGKILADAIRAEVEKL